jgi:hypothetical protein
MKKKIEEIIEILFMTLSFTGVVFSQVLRNESIEEQNN